MEILPAIDLCCGKVVRLSQGDYDRQTVYADDPLEVAREKVRWILENHQPAPVGEAEQAERARENMSQLVDTPKRRAFMKKIGQRGWLGMTWPKKYGGSEGEGVYEYLLNERLAGAGRGVGPGMCGGRFRVGRLEAEATRRFHRPKQDLQQMQGPRGLEAVVMGRNAVHPFSPIA